MKKIFVGPKEVSLKNTSFFDASVNLIGSSKNGNISYSEERQFEFWNPDNAQREIKIYNELLKKISEPAEVMGYNPNLLRCCDIPDHMKLICINDIGLINIFDDKIKTRSFFSGIVPILNYITLKGYEFSYKELAPNGETLVVQLPYGGGGSKTFLCSVDNYKEIEKKCDNSEIYSVSVYQRGCQDYNIHCIVGKEQILLFAPSMQVLEISDKIEYDDSDYNLDLPVDLKGKMREYSLCICKKLQEKGYCGVVGIDYIYFGGELYFIEINPRFQGSTVYLEELLNKSKLPSIYDYNYRAFNNYEMKDKKNMIGSIMI